MIKSPCAICNNYKKEAPECFKNCETLKKLQTLTTIIPIDIKTQESFNIHTNFESSMFQKSYNHKPAQ